MDFVAALGPLIRLGDAANSRFYQVLRSAEVVKPMPPAPSGGTAAQRDQRAAKAEGWINAFGAI